MNSAKNFPIRPNPDLKCPPEILNKQVALVVKFYGFDGQYHVGSIEINRLVVNDIEQFFAMATNLKFPIEKVSPANDTLYKWSDEQLMKANVSSGFNYRLVAGTDNISLHGQGLAFDINPIQNPYIRHENNQVIVSPKGATWEPSKPGTLTSNHPLVKLMKERGWEWGGDWIIENGIIDYQHFQKQMNL